MGRGSSRIAKEGAGWDVPPAHGTPRWRRLMAQRRRTLWGNFTWISPGPLLASVNDKIAKGLDDVVNGHRSRWVTAVRRGDWSDEALNVTTHAERGDVSFLVIGDPGEQDASQYATVAPILAKGAGTDFAIVASDVIYPAGDINDYLDGFYLPYQDYGPPIYAVPGNHDWYDGLNGFMFHFCGADPLPPETYRAGSYSWRGRLARLLWRNPSPPQLAELVRERCKRAPAGEPWQPPQPGPYYTIDTERLRIVCIDTGITGTIDREQGDWLRRVSRDPRDKVLITGKPIYADGKYHPGRIEWGVAKGAEPDDVAGECHTVDDIVRDPRHRYIAAIGGDVHNYQHYPVDVQEPGEPRPRRIHYVVNGGGGAYLSATHRFVAVDLAPGRTKDLPATVKPIAEEDVTLYPLRGDSLARFVSTFPRILRWALFGAWFVLAVGAVVFLDNQQGIGDRINVLAIDPAERTAEKEGPQRWLAVLVAAAWLLVTAGIGWLTVKIFKGDRLLATGRSSRGYRALLGTFFGFGLASLVVFGTYQLAGAEAWHWVWRIGVSTALAIAVPVTIVVVYYLVRDFISPPVRAALGFLPLIVVGAIAMAKALEGLSGAVALTVTVALGVLLILVLFVGVLRDRGARLPPKTNVFEAALVGQWARRSTHGGEEEDESEHKLRRRIGVLLPAVAGAAGTVVLLASIPNGSSAAWIPAGMLWMALALTMVLAAALLVVARRAFCAARWLIHPAEVDADEIARWMADELGRQGSDCEPVRERARNATISKKAKRLAALTYKSRPITNIVSELAEATSPPFFKSFLRIDVEGRTLTIRCYGVTGHLGDEDDPVVEHEVAIPVKLPADLPTPSVV
jgi:hypothetical protein